MLTPKSHQIDAIQANVKAFEQTNRIKNIMACGTGKTLTFIKTIEALYYQSKIKDVVIFAPTILLMQQLAVATINNFQNIFNYALVCSRKKAGELDDADIDDVRESLSIPVFESKQDVALFLASDDKPKILFCTYSSGHLLRGIHFDFAVYDEAHKTAGEVSKPFAFSLDNKNVQIDKRLFMTATERVIYHHTRSNRIGMNNIAQYGETAYSLPFKKAIELGLITDYKLLVTVVRRSDIAHLLTDDKNKNAVMLANAVALEKAKAQFNINKIVTFHATIAAAEQFTKALEDFGALNMRHYHINGSQKTELRNQIMREFAQSESATITNARCLTEGIDVPNIDAVAFLDPKSSTIDVIQALGRAVRTAPGKHYGYIILPLYIDNFDQAMSNESLSDHAGFGNIIDVVSVLKNEDEDLKTSLLYAIDSSEKILKNINIEIIGNIPDGLSKEVMLENIAIEIASNYDSYFMEMLKEFDKFKEENESGYIYIDNPNRKLALWANAQRFQKRYKTIPKYREALLNEHGFIFSIFDQQWEESFAQYKSFKAQGLQDDEIEDAVIKKWVTRQKGFFKNGRLSDNRLQRLKTVGFEYRSLDDIWMRGYNILLAELEIKKSLSSITKKDQSFEWMRVQRRRWEKLDDKRKDLLLNLGWNDYVKNLGRWKD